MGDLLLLSTASNRHVVESFDRTVLALQKSADRVIHLGLATDLWYAGDAAAAYRQAGAEVVMLPRPSGSRVPWWQNADIVSEAGAAWREIESVVTGLIVNRAPRVFLIADDTGPFEAFFIQLMNRHRVPVVLLEHGYGFAFAMEKRWSAAMRQWPAAIKRRLTAGKRETTDNAQAKELPAVAPFGKNGEVTICAYSGWTKTILVKHGIAEKIIHETGYPYFDGFVRRPETRAASNEKKHILVVSTGWGLFGQSERAREFYAFIAKLPEALDDRYRLFLRPKMGETPQSYLPPGLGESSFSARFEPDDPAIPSLRALPRYDLVFGEPSTVMLEAVLLGIPIVLFRRREGAFSAARYSLETVLHDILGARRIRKPSEAAAAFAEAMRPEYSRRLLENLWKNERRLFCKLDGRAGARVAAVVLTAVQNRKDEKAR